MVKYNKLISNINLCLSFFLMIHAAVFFALSLKIGWPLWVTVGCLAGLFLYHVLLMFGLSRVPDLFVYTGVGATGADLGEQRLDRLNPAIIITLSRLTSLPSIIYLIFLTTEYSIQGILIIYVVLAFITDFLDGKISRNMNQTTKIGAYLDSLSDYIMLLAITLAYFNFRLLPSWFLILVLLRLGFQAVSAIGLSVLNKRLMPYKSSLLSKASIFLVMLTCAFALLRLLPVFSSGLWADFYPPFMAVLQLTGAVALVLSLGEKIILFGQELHAARQQPGPGTGTEAD